MTDVNPAPESTEQVVPVIEPVVEPVVTPPAPAPGSQTDPALLLKSLQEEREKRRLAEEALARATAPADEVFSDEGKALLTKISKLEDVIASNEHKEALTAIQTTYPALADKATEFETFRTDPANAGMKLETAAKAFLAENGLLESPKTRKGLEQSTGGGRAAPQTGQMTPAEVDDLRINNYRKYSDMIRKGQIKVG